MKEPLTPVTSSSLPSVSVGSFLVSASSGESGYFGYFFAVMILHRLRSCENVLLGNASWM